MAETKESSRVLILGGSGFIGRNFVKFLVDNNLASYIKVADKSIPATGYLSAEHKAAFDNPIVKFQQADLSRERMWALTYLEFASFCRIVVNCNLGRGFEALTS